MAQSSKAKKEYQEIKNEDPHEKKDQEFFEAKDRELQGTKDDIIKNIFDKIFEEDVVRVVKSENNVIKDGKKKTNLKEEIAKLLVIDKIDKIVVEVDHVKKPTIEKNETTNNSISNASNKDLQCPRIPVDGGLIQEYKPHWKISNHDFKKIVAIPEYIAEAMANAVSSKDANMIVVPPQDPILCAPQCPILIFINSRSGGQLGPDILIHLSELISPLQVYDVARIAPDAMFCFGLGCLDKLSVAGDAIAQAVRKNLRIMIAGGDGTAGWVLTSLRSFQETLITDTQNIPPVGIIPLGTGNDLARSFGWGGQFPFATRHNVKKWLVKAIYATTTPLDSWQVMLKPSPSLPKSHFRMPCCLDVSQKSEGASTSEGVSTADLTYTGIFRNYFSVGMDAQVAFGFHNFRNHMPWIARGRLANQMIYGGFSCTQGWFCTACSCKKTRGVKNDVRLFVKRQASVKEWEFIYVPSYIRAIVILNLQSYAGGRNPWGYPRDGRKQGYVPAAPNDGLLEIVGLRDGWHATFIMISALTAIRLCQAAAVRLEISGNRSAAYMQMDGEPWQQPLANSQEPPTILELTLSTPPSIMLQGWRVAYEEMKEKKKNVKNKKKHKSLDP